MSLVTRSSQLAMPKAQIADLLDARFPDLGVHTPRRLTLQEALANPSNVLARSEHPLELAGPSGLVESLPLAQVLSVGASDLTHSLTHSLTAEQLALDLLAHDPYGTYKDREWPSRNHRSIWRYAKLTNQNPADIVNAYRFSFWELIAGRNATVVADDAVEGRMHVFLAGTGDAEDLVACTSLNLSWEARIEAIQRTHASCLLTLDHGALVFAAGTLKRSVAMDVLAESAKQMCAVYQRVQNSGLFDVNECPIMEFQQDASGKVYFLQYHIGKRKSVLPDFDLSDKIKGDDSRAVFVSGKTPPEGSEFDVLFGLDGEDELRLSTALQGAVGLYAFPIWEPVFEQVSLRNLSLYLGLKNPSEFDLMMSEPQHASVSRFFKPELTVWVDLKDQIPVMDLMRIGMKKGLSRIRVKVLSNGHEARVWYLGSPDLP